MARHRASDRHPLESDLGADPAGAGRRGADRADAGLSVPARWPAEQRRASRARQRRRRCRGSSRPPWSERRRGIPVDRASRRRRAGRRRCRLLWRAGPVRRGRDRLRHLAARWILAAGRCGPAGRHPAAGRTRGCSLALPRCSSFATSSTAARPVSGSPRSPPSAAVRAGGGDVRSRGGAGLGLPIAFGLICLHGGALAIESRPGKGTTVLCRFPASRVRRSRARLVGG